MTDIDRYEKSKEELLKINQKIQKILQITIIACVNHIGDIRALSNYIHGIIDDGIHIIDEINNIAKETDVILHNSDDIDSIRKKLDSERKLFDDAVIIGSHNPTTIVDYNFTQHFIRILNKL